MKRETRLAAVISVAALLILELLVRLLPLPKHLTRELPDFASKSGPGIFYWHPYHGFEFKPGAVSEDQQIRINSRGFRGPELEHNRPIEIVLLGGSSILGIKQVEERIVSGYLAPRVVVNAGLISATSAEDLHRLIDDILPLKPKYLVYYNAFNDLVPRSFNNYSDDYWHFRASSGRRCNGLFDFSVAARIIKFAIWPECADDYDNLLSYIFKWENFPSSQEAMIANFRKNGPQAYAKNVEQLILSTKAAGITPILMTFGFDSAKKNWTDLFPASLWQEGIEQNNAILKELARKHQVILIDLAPLVENDKGIMADSIHFEPHGAKVVADLIEKAIASAESR